jgi:hypothetical protein
MFDGGAVSDGYLWSRSLYVSSELESLNTHSTRSMRSRLDSLLGVEVFQCTSKSSIRMPRLPQLWNIFESEY